MTRDPSRSIVPADTPFRGAKARKYALTAYAVLFFSFLYLPILLLVLLSVNDSQVMAPSFQGFTWRWYGVVFSSARLLHSIGASLMIGIASSVIATALAVLLALGLRRNIPFKSFILKVILLPILIPGVVAGVVYQMFFGYVGLTPDLWLTVLPVHITWVLPFAFLTVFPRIQGLDRGLEEAAADLGASGFTVFRRIVLPLIRPSIVATILFGFTLSFDEFVRTYFVVGDDLTVPVYLWNMLAEEMAPFLPAVGVVITLISVLASLLGFLMNSWARRRGTFLGDEHV